jgi:erythromycin esterase-like protein
MKEPSNGTTPGSAAPTAAITAKARGRPPGSSSNLGKGASTEARRLASAILEVLAGARSAPAAAQALGLTLQRYYLLEVRALHGMLLACEPRSIGRVKTSESALAALQRECEQLRRECGRQQALVRAAQRTIGLAPPPAPKPTKRADGKKHRRRRPLARALRAAAQLRPEPTEVLTPGMAAPEVNGQQ